MAETRLDQTILIGPDYTGWDISQGNLESYTTTFRRLLEGKTFGELIAMRKLQGKKAYVADYMGYGFVIRGLNESDGGVALALSDPREDKSYQNLKRSDQRSNISQITGDIQNTVSWEKTTAWLRGQEEQSFYLSFLRPNGALGLLQEDLDLNAWLLQKIWERMSPDGGLLFAEFSPQVTSLMGDLVKKLGGISGLRANLIKINDGSILPPYSIFGLQRWELAPLDLPIKKIY
jgi:hypothetical protein